MTTVTITETANTVTVDDENVQVVNVSLVNTATTTSAGLMSASDKSKLDGIESSADVTDATNVEAAGAVMETDTSTTNMQFVVDEDNMASDSATKIPTQQSVKAYVDSQISSKDELSELSGDLDDISDGTNHVKMTNAERTKLTGIETGATADQSATEIKSLYESNSDTNAFTDSEQTKLSGIENNATADQSASEILTAIKTVDGATSGLDADLLDGQEGSYYQQASTALNTITSFGGDVSGTYNAIVVADDSHNHIIGNVDGLQTELDAKAPLASPALIGTPTAPTAAVDDSTTKIATTAFVQQELAQLVDSAPSTLDTLNEIAAAINDDANFNTTVTNSLANRLRVDTAAQGLTSTQQNNAKTNLGLDDVATSGAYSDLTGTPTIPTNNNELTNGAGYITSADGGNAQTLDSLDSTQFLRSDAADVKTSGQLRFNDDVQLKIGSDGDLAIFHVSATGHTNISESGSGNLYVSASNLVLQSTTGEPYFKGFSNGSVELYHDNTKKFETVSNGVALTGNLLLSDNEKAIFGAGSDLQIFHNGNHSYIQDSGTGDLVVLTNQIAIRNAAQSADIIRGIEGGAVTLSHNGSAKIDTTSTGATVTGTLQAGIFKTDATPSASSIFNTSTNLYPLLISRGDDETQVLQIGVDDAQVIFNSLQDEQYGGFLFTSEADGFGTRNRLVIDSGDGDISFYNNTGANRNFYWDATNSRLGINNTSPSTALDVNGDLTLTSTDGGASENPTLDLYRNSASPANSDVMGHIQFSGNNSSGSKVVYTEIETLILNNTAGDEDARVRFNILDDGSQNTVIELGYDRVQFSESIFLNNGKQLIFEGATADDFETTLTATEPTQDNTITLPDATGTVLLNAGNQTLTGDLTFPDNEKAIFGSGSDLTISHDGSNSRIKDVGTGSLLIGASFVGIQKADGSETAAKFFNDGAVELYHDNSKKLETTSIGATTTGQHAIVNQSGYGAVEVGGTSGAFVDLKNPNSDDYDIRLITTGTGGQFLSQDALRLGSTGTTSITNVSGNSTYANFIPAGAVELFYSGNKKLETTSSGATITGVLTADGLDLGDNERLRIGASPTSDLQIWHDGTNSNIVNGTGSLIIADTSGDVKIQGKYGEQSIVANNDGAVELYHDNSKKLETTSTGATITGVLTSDGLDLGDNEKIRLGASQDLEIYHDGSNSYIDESGTGNLYIRAGGNNNISLTDNAVYLYYNGSTKLQTTSDGASITGDLQITSTDAGATENPTLDLYRNSASPANNDKLGHINFSAENDASEKIVYAEIEAQTTQVTDGNEYGAVNISAMINGTFTQYYQAIYGENRFNKNIKLKGGVNLLFQGATENSNETTLTVTDPTQDNTVSLPDASGTVLLNTGDQSITGNLTLTATDDTSGSTPEIKFVRQSTSPADFDYIGGLSFFADNSADENIEFGTIEARLRDVTDGTEDFGGFELFGIRGGAARQRFMILNEERLGFMNYQFLRFEDGSSNHFTIAPPSSLSASQTITLPDATGTVALQEQAYQSINAQTGTTYTTVLADGGKLVTLSNGSAITLTIPPNSSVAYPVGTKLDFIQTGAGQVTVAGGSGVTVNSTPTLKTRAQHSGASCIKIAADTWQLVGDLAAS